MGIKVYHPNTHGRRIASVDDYSDVTSSTPEKSLLVIKKRTGGRNAQGKLTVRHIGGGNKQFIRLIDFKRDKFDIPGTVKSIEYDPNRNARIALIVYADGEKRYIIAPISLHTGDKVVSSRGKVAINPGNATTLENIPEGTMIYNVELFPGKGGQIVRSAGTQAKLLTIDGDFAQVRLPSSEVRLVPKICFAVVGQVSNPEVIHVTIGKAGRNRHRGIKPSVRGKVMNPVDHPHGGGEGRNPIGLPYAKTPWGKPAMGKKTRKPQASDMYIVKRRQK